MEAVPGVQVRAGRHERPDVVQCCVGHLSQKSLLDRRLEVEELVPAVRVVDSDVFGTASVLGIHVPRRDRLLDGLDFFRGARPGQVRLPAAVDGTVEAAEEERRVAGTVRELPRENLNTACAIATGSRWCAPVLATTTSTSFGMTWSNAP